MQGRHSDNDLDRLHRSRWRVVLLWLMIALATVVMLIVTGNMIGSTRNVVDTSTQNDQSDPIIVTETITETEEIEVPGPVETSTVPGPRVIVTRTIYPTPSVTPSPVPGPTVTIKVTAPAPTVYQRTPGPETTETIIKCYTWNMIEITCPEE